MPRLAQKHNVDGMIVQLEQQAVELWRRQWAYVHAAEWEDAADRFRMSLTYNGHVD